MPIYPDVGAWTTSTSPPIPSGRGRYRQGMTFSYDWGRRQGMQHVARRRTWPGIASCAYDFVASSHVVEHLANPLKGLKEWLRVVRPGGSLLLIVPHKEGTFDHRRPVTPLAHLLDDFNAGTGEDDLTHLPEILELHDIALDPGVADAEAFRQHSLRNAETRCLHHHVFTTHRLLEVLDYLKVQILAVEPRRPYHIIVLAEKPDGKEEAERRDLPDNARFLGPDADYRRNSPFSADRRPEMGTAGS